MSSPKGCQVNPQSHMLHPEVFLLALRVEQPFGQRSVARCLAKAAVTSAYRLSTRDRLMRHDFES